MANRAAEQPRASAAVYRTPAAALEAYKALGRCSTFSPAQSPAWVSAWIAETEPDFVIATLSLQGVPSYALAVEIVRRGPFNIARFMGGHHANGNFSPLAASAPPLSRADLDILIASIGKERPDIDLLSLERVADTIEGRTNPLMTLPHLQSPNPALATDLSGGFDALLERTSGKRKRKKNRSQSRKFEAAGGFRFVTATTPDEASRFLEAFFSMKQERFRKMGLADVFATPEVRRFFHRLFGDALAEKTPPFVLDGLEVAGQLRAVTGSSRCDDRLICEFGAIREDELSRLSPGDFLFFDNIRRACADGLALYDFSVGDEPYKRLWCDVEITHYDVLVPMTMGGRILVHAMRAKNRLKAFIKKNSLAWRLTQTLRRRRGSRSEQG
ncbi:GNAT family N-acetyltransferase [Mesorhizobium sp. 1B3]|uniref:GNAT family N-acetyltransferase n=1 Tax=Mesorhizobium sp. 1B3 TaxID=3243599 RepID=UPI003D97E8B5